MKSAVPPDCCTGDGASIDNLLDRNRQWVERKTRTDPDFFARLAGQQEPDYFWIGCSDSRVPATEIVDLDPGEMFVHRNVANLAGHDDASANAALSFAVEQLKVRHVIVAGHYGCGGISAVMTGAGPDGTYDWLAPLRALRLRHGAELDAIADFGRRCDRLCELNVIDQVTQLALHPIITAAWQHGQPLTIHGIIYAVGNGRLRKVCIPVSKPFAAGRDGAIQEGVTEERGV